MTLSWYWRDYYELCKPRVVGLMLLTSIVGMQLASPQFLSLQPLLFGTLGIGLCAASAAVMNHLADRHIDSLMSRTEQRPLPSGRLKPRQAFIFALILGCLGMFILMSFVNILTSILTLITLMGYAVVYTLYLKRATPQNIVIGGAAGAAPPLLGWTAVTGHLDPQALLLVLIIFVWTPPHFWALSIARYSEYSQAKIPMLPVTHGIDFTKLSILLYTVLLIAVSVLPTILEMSGIFYLFIALLSDAGFLYCAIKLYQDKNNLWALRMFKYSIIYLMLIFIALLFDHFLVN